MKHGQKIFLICAVVVALDQFTKWIVVQNMPFQSERVVLDGFFKFVHWGNTGAAWSMFSGQSHMLAIVSCVALLALFLARKHFFYPGPGGFWSMGLLYGGIIGNLIDRLSHPGHVTDFIYFYLHQQGGREIGFPAFNIADMAICFGVGLLFLLSWQTEAQRHAEQKQLAVEPAPSSTPSGE